MELIATNKSGAELGYECGCYYFKDADSDYFSVRHRHHAEPDEYSPVSGTEYRQAGGGTGYLLHH